MAKKRNYAKERRMAMQWADHEMNRQQKDFPAGVTLPLFWDDIYTAYLAGLRGRAPNASKKQ